MDFSRRFAIAAVACIYSGMAIAGGLAGAAAIKDRQAHMKALGASTKAIGEQFRSGAPDPTVIKREAAKIDVAAQQLPTWFPAGSGPSAGVKTEALPLIWADPTGFAAKAHALALAARAFHAAADSGNSAAIGAAGHDLGAACKGCHETYRVKEKI